MAENSYQYVIVGAGVTGGWAVAGIGEVDTNGSILLLGQEPYLPYDRPPLTKKLWFGKEKVENIFPHDDAYYAGHRADVRLGVTVTALDAGNKMLTDGQGNTIHYEKLLLATGGAPRRLDIPGGDLDGICYYRYLIDYLRMRADAVEGASAVVVGGGFIGSEIAAALNMQQVDVTMVFTEDYLVSRIFPEGLGRALTDHFQHKGVKVMAGDAPVSFTRQNGKFLTQTKSGRQLPSDILLVGIGIQPADELAKAAGLQTANGITVNAYLQTSHPDIYAAGDNAFFPYQALGKQMRIEHWDNAVNQGKWAGRNMAGANEPFTYLPYFFSDLFEFGYEAVGEVSSKLESFADWQQENDTGVLYYLQDGKVRGVMTCNIYGKLDQARDLIRSGAQMTPDQLRGMIREEKKAA